MASGNKGSYKILIVDEDRDMRTFLNNIFSEKGYRVSQASNGEMALDILPDVMPDLVLIDLHMSGVNGLEVLRSVKSHPEFKYIKIILLSSESNVNERLKGYEMGADDYMIKPFAGGELLAKAEVFMRMTYIEEKNLSLEDLVQKELEKYKKQEEYMLTQAKLISMGDMVLAISHYWRQPLNALAISIQDVQDAFMHKELTEEYLKKSVEESMLHISFMSAIIDNFQKMVSDDKSDALFNFQYAIKDAVLLIKDRLEKADTDLFINRLPCDEYFSGSTINYYIRGRDWILKQALSSLIQAALDAILRKRSNGAIDYLRCGIRVKIWNTDNSIHISIGGDGEELEERELDRVFEPYYKAGERIDAGNEGLGLYFSRALVERQLGGKIYAANKSGKTFFFMEVPCAYEEV